MVDRWAVSPFSCDAQTHSGDGESCAERADAVILPTAAVRCFSEPDDLYAFKERTGDEIVALHMHFWSQVRRRFTNPLQLVVIHSLDSCDLGWNNNILEALARQPSSFIRRVVIVSMDNPFLTSQCRDYRLEFEAAGASPTYIVVPFAIHTLNVVDASRERVARPFSVLFVGRLCAPTRRATFDLMLRANATCIDDSFFRFTVGNWMQHEKHLQENVVLCTLCAHELTPAACATWQRDL